VICNPAETSPRFHGIVYVVERLARVNAILMPVGGGRGLVIHPSALLPAPTDIDSAADVAASSAAAYVAPLSVGTVVTVASPRWRGGTGLFVVLRDDGERASIVRLGGEAGRYWPKIPRGWLTTVDRDQLLAAVTPLTGGPS
jgi:hypothetical protein